eukprot:m.307403 g.307403  ORF g.307403 m.307403 type:complete len:337 (-) comp19628_c1_seq10:90-1100(-)
MSRYSEGRIYVGNLPRDIREKELDDLFYKYGRITDISIKSMGHGPAFAFVTFEDSRDADEAIRGRQGYDFADGCRLRVEPSNGGRGGGGGRDSGRSFTGRRSDFRVSITGLPRGSSWQDVKDFCREAGDVLFTDIEGEGRGVVEFAREDDMKWALRHLDGKEFRSHTRSVEEGPNRTLRNGNGMEPLELFPRTHLHTRSGFVARSRGKGLSLCLDHWPLPGCHQGGVERAWGPQQAHAHQKRGTREERDGHRQQEARHRALYCLVLCCVCLVLYSCLPCLCLVSAPLCVFRCFLVACGRSADRGRQSQGQHGHDFVGFTFIFGLPPRPGSCITGRE